MRLVDTHCHLDLPEYSEDLDAVIANALDSGVVRIISPGINLASSKKAVELSRRYDSVFAAVGVHPHDADKVTDEDIDKLRIIAADAEKVVAIGEVGLDYFKGYSEARNQRELFGKCLKMAHELDLPVILHNREANEDFLALLKENNLYELKGVVHCFSGDVEFLKEILAMDLYVSFTGTVTFKTAEELRRVVREVPPEKLLLETDGPYMAPVPFRGKRNEPAYVKRLLDVYAEIYGLSAGDVARITTHNANMLFGLGLETPGAIVYPIRDSLYVNLTNRCTNRCNFCTRNISYFVKGHNLKLDHEPTADEVIDQLGDLDEYKEVVFCGLGEPTLRLGALKKISAYVKAKGGKVRINTNGEGNLIEKRAIAPELEGVVDSVSVSLNATNAGDYQHMCKSVFGEEAYDSIFDFVKDCSSLGIKVEVTCLDFLGEKIISEIREKVEQAGADLRIRHLNVVG